MEGYTPDIMHAVVNSFLLSIYYVYKLCTIMSFSLFCGTVKVISYTLKCTLKTPLLTMYIDCIAVYVYHTYIIMLTTIPTIYIVQ